MILLFSKIPGVAKAKTRLVKDGLKKEDAQLLATAFLADTLELIASVDCPVSLVLEPKVEINGLETQLASIISGYKLPQLTNPKLLSQEGASFGEKLEQAIYQTYEHSKSPILILGSDCPLLSAREINSALELLKENKSVFGPTPNGGMYLIGLSKEALEQGFSVKDLFTEESSLELETFAKALKQADLPYLLLRTLPDVDVLEDLIGLKTILTASETSLNKELSSMAPNTRKVLDEISLEIKRDNQDSRGFCLVNN